MAKKKTIDPTSMDPEELREMTMFAMASMGVTPEEYSDYYKKFGMGLEIFGMSGLGLFDSDDDSNPDANGDFANWRRPGFGGGQSWPKSGKEPDAKASEKSLVLKIQIKGVAKPPVWREVVVPADYTFSQLHYVIQAVFGLYNCHLWQFEKSAYSSGYKIGIPLTDEFGFGIDDATHNADDTFLTSFLSAKGDKIEYVYDFGDDWIFTITVKDVVAREGEIPKLLKWKSDMQPAEDSGGPYMYEEFRELNGKWASMKKKERKKAAEEMGYDDEEYLDEMFETSWIDPEHIAEELAEIPGKFENPE